MSYLEVEDLTVAFPSPGGWIEAVREVSFSVEKGEFVGLVGESGSGKSLTALSLLRLTPPPGEITNGRVLLEGEDLLTLPSKRMRRVRGAKIAMVFQEPMTALNPVFTIGWQLVEAVRVHHPDVSKKAAREEARRLLEVVAIPDPESRLSSYPHQLSGGQRQRVMIAMALAAEPELLLADEPTTALDVTIQAQILELLEKLRNELGLAVLLITHDLAVVAETCDRVVVMYSGEVAEEASADDLFGRPDHPYTRGLLKALPRLGRPVERGHLPTIPGQVPDPRDRPSGCPFHPRCPDAMDVCPRYRPELYTTGPDHRARCFLHGEPREERRVPEAETSEVEEVGVEAEPEPTTEERSAAS